VQVFGRLADRFGKLLVFRVMALLTVVPLLLVTHLPALEGWAVLPVVLGVTTLFMVTTSGRWVPAQALMTACAAPRDRGGFLSVLTSVQQMASALAAALGGALITMPRDGAGLVAGGAVTGPVAFPITGYGLVG